MSLSLRKSKVLSKLFIYDDCLNVPLLNVTDTFIELHKNEEFRLISDDHKVYVIRIEEVIKDEH